MHDVSTLQKLLDPLFPGLMGIRLLEIAPDRVVGEMTVRADLCTVGGILQRVASSRPDHDGVANVDPEHRSKALRGGHADTAHARDIAVNQTSSRTVLISALYLSSCTWNVSTIPLHGEFAGQHIATTVDAPIASYYVESYLAGARHREDWDVALNAIHRELGDRLPTSMELRDWSRLYSTDLATLVLARQVSRQAQKQPLDTLFHEELSAVLNAQRSGNLDALAVDPDFLILFVPGWLYKSDSTTGADFARFRAHLSRHGARVALIETGENLSVEENAKLIEAQILRLAASRQQLILVSGSKGGPEVALALSNLRDHPAGRQVKAWLNIGGLLHGTRLADVGLSWPTCWFVYLAVLPDRSFEGIRSLSTAQSTTRLAAIQLPQDTLVVNYLGIPLSGQVSDQARGGYSRLKMDGPNDGLTYLAEAIAPNSVTIPELGVDHYFRRSDIDLKSLALARAIARHVKQRGAQQVAAADAPQAARH
jgi:hypothetical protein